jgi:hypothetical protein
MKKQSIEALGGVEVQVSNIPVVVHKGIYTLWEKPDGTLRIQYRREGNDTDDFVELPGALVKMAKGMAEGKLNPMDMIKEVMKLRPPQ